MNTLRMFGKAMVAAAREVRVWLPAYLLVTLVALSLVLPALAALHETFDHQPAAAVGLSAALDLDLARHRPDLLLQGWAAVVLVLCGWTFLAGGLLATAGKQPRPRLGEFLAACGSGLWPSLRVLAIGLVLALLLGFGVASFDGWLREVRLADADPGAGIAPLGLHLRVFTLGFALEALRWCYGALFLVLLFAAKVARAQLAAGRCRSAARSWLLAVGNLLRHPLRTALILVLLVAVWLGSGFVLGFAVDWAERSGLLWAMLAFSQAHVVLLQILLAATLLAARSSAGIVDVAEVEIADEGAPVPVDAAVSDSESHVLSMGAR